jgi:hypothetical protein
MRVKAVAEPASLRHVLPEKRDRFEEEHGITYCRRCGAAIVNDRYPDKKRKPCPGNTVRLRGD